MCHTAADALPLIRHLNQRLLRGPASLMAGRLSRDIASTGAKDSATSRISFIVQLIDQWRIFQRARSRGKRLLARKITLSSQVCPVSVSLTNFHTSFPRMSRILSALISSPLRVVRDTIVVNERLII